MQVAVTRTARIIQSVNVPDSHGHMANVALGFKDIAGYTTGLPQEQPVLRAIIGRYGNRIAKGTFTLPNGKSTTSTSTIPEHAARRVQRLQRADVGRDAVQDARHGGREAAPG